MKTHYLERFNPAAFAYVMATIVISLILYLMEWRFLSLLFFILGLIGYGLLVILAVARFIFFGKKALQEFTDIHMLFKYYTFCAGTNELAARFIFNGYDYIGLTLGIIGTVSTLLLTYTLFGSLLFHKNYSIESVSPLWLLMAIANNSVGIVITTLRQHHVLVNDLFLLGAFCFWAFGVVIYVCFITLNIYRFLFLPLKGKDLSPSYWTCMGAAAIAVVDGSSIILSVQPPQFLQLVTPFMAGTILLLWGWGTGWIPILFFMGMLKHGYYKIPMQYDSSFWAMVFPLGMYTFAIHILNSSVHLGLVQGVVPFCMWTSIIVWIFVACLKFISYSPTSLN